LRRMRNKEKRRTIGLALQILLVPAIGCCNSLNRKLLSSMMGRDITPESGRLELVVLEEINLKEADRIYRFGKGGKHHVFLVCVNDLVFFI
jgi:hypothetical protein